MPGYVLGRLSVKKGQKKGLVIAYVGGMGAVFYKVNLGNLERKVPSVFLPNI